MNCGFEFSCLFDPSLDGIAAGRLLHASSPSDGDVTAVGLSHREMTALQKALEWLRWLEKSSRDMKRLGAPICSISRVLRRHPASCAAA